MYLCVYVCELSSGTFARTFEDLQYNDESGVIVVSQKRTNGNGMSDSFRLYQLMTKSTEFNGNPDSNWYPYYYSSSTENASKSIFATIITAIIPSLQQLLSTFCSSMKSAFYLETL